MDPETMEDHQQQDAGDDEPVGIVPPPGPVPPEATVTPDEGGSVLDVVRRKRTEIAGVAEPLVLVLGAYDDRVAIRFRYPDEGWKALRDVGRRTEQSRDPLAELNALADTIGVCCDEVLARDPQTGELGPLDPAADVDDPPVRFDSRLAALIGLDVPAEVKARRRFIVRNFYSPRASATGVYRGDPALTADAIRLSEWLEKAEGAVNDSLLGES